MAVRERAWGFSGGIARWVSCEEAQELAREVAALATADDLLAWCEASAEGHYPLLAYRIRLGVVGDAFDRGAVAAELIVKLAHDRRRGAITEYVRENSLNVGAAVGIDQSGRSLARCPVCHASINLGHERDFYCRKHLAERDDEVAEMLGEA